MPRRIRGRRSSRKRVDGKCRREDTAGSLSKKAQARVKRRGKSSPRPAVSERQEKPHAVQDKTGGGQPVRHARRNSGRSPGIVAPRCVITVSGRREKFRNEINDRPGEKSGGQNSAYRHHIMKGAFGNGGALRFCRSCLASILSLDRRLFRFSAPLGGLL